MLKNALSTLTDGLISLTYPQDCRICGAPVDRWNDGVACDSCWNDRSLTQLFLETPVCIGCGNPLAGAAPFFHDSKRRRDRCGLCDQQPFAAARACGFYSGALESSVLYLKSHPWLPGRLRTIVAQTLVQHLDALSSDLIMPVPLHRNRYKERGFNQALVISRTVAKVYRTEIDNVSLKRIINTDRHRSGMDAQDRVKSVKGAFEICRPRSVAGRSVLLVDDVFTTGSTISAAARSLLDAGAIRVSVFTLARVPFFK